MKLDDMDWSKVYEKHVYLVQNNKSGEVYTCDDRLMDVKKRDLTILATRPKPPLTEEQVEAVKEYIDWYSNSRGIHIQGEYHIDAWLKQRGGEHE